MRASRPQIFPVIHTQSSTYPKFYFEYAYIQVEDELFKLPRYKFEEESETFRLWSPRPREEFGRSWVPENPLFRSGFSKLDFVNFLSMFYPRGLAAPSTSLETIELLESALKVARSMQLITTRKRILSHLQETVHSGPAPRLILGMDYSDQQLAIAAASALVNREQSISWAEAELVGPKVAFHLFRAREARINGARESVWKLYLEEELKLFPAKPYKLVLFPLSRRSPTHYVEEIVFLVGDELFNIPRYPFLNDSEIFSDMFSIPCSGISNEGTSDGNPIVLEGISKQDFDSFLEALYIPLSDRVHLPWTRFSAALKLSTMWRFKTIRDETISHLDTVFQQDKGLAPHQLTLGRSEKVPSWILDGYYELVKRERSLTVDDRSLLTPATTWMIWELRDMYTPVISNGQRLFRRTEKSKTQVEAAIADELKEAVFVD